MNFNFSNQPDYSLNSSMINEVINLYGVLTKFMVVLKINRDDTVFGDYSHLKSDGSKIFDLYALPEVMEEWTQENYGFSEFGFVNSDSIGLFVSRKDMERIYQNFDEGKGFKDIIGNLLVLPNNRILEITDIEHEVPGMNNLFTQNDIKTVYKLSCRTYNQKLITEIDSVDVAADPKFEGDYETLDTYFSELIDSGTAQDNEAEVNDTVKTVKRNTTIDEIVQKPIVDNSEDNIFGRF